MWHLRVVGIEVRHTLTANAASKHILVSINQSIDALLSKFVDKLFDSIKVSIVVLSWSSFDRFPHYTEPHEVKAPLF